jgi:hypothetical protein
MLVVGASVEDRARCLLVRVGDGPEFSEVIWSVDVGMAESFVPGDSTTALVRAPSAAVRALRQFEPARVRTGLLVSGVDFAFSDVDSSAEFVTMGCSDSGGRCTRTLDLGTIVVERARCRSTVERVRSGRVVPNSGPVPPSVLLGRSVVKLEPCAARIDSARCKRLLKLPAPRPAARPVVPRTLGRSVAFPSPTTLVDARPIRFDAA